MLKTAFQFIRYDKPKSLGALFGVIISIFLIGQQTGIFTFLTGAMSRLVDITPTGLWVVDNKTTDVNALGQLDTRLGYEIESLPGVARAYPLVIGGGSARFLNGTTAGVQVIGAQMPVFRGGPQQFVRGSKADLIAEGGVSIDEFDSKALGGATLGTDFEISGKRVRARAVTKGVRGFGAYYVFTTLERARFLGSVPVNKVSAFLIDLQPGADTLQVREAINRHIYGVRAWKPADFSRETVKTVLGQSGIAISFGTLVVFAVITGLIIIGLTLYSATVDRIRDYATLKAIGATNGYITRLILMQALIFALVGFVLSYGLLEGFRFGIGKTGAIFSYSWFFRGAFLLITLFISLVGAIFAIRRITNVEPATVFRG